MEAGAGLSPRQQREIDYHREHARQNREALSAPVSWDVLRDPGRRRWNAYWRMYEFLLGQELAGRRALVVGCGSGEDALRLAKLGAEVHAFDLSPDCLAIARERAENEGLHLHFDEMPSERLGYADNSFDVVLARDIFHHVDIPATMGEVVRVARPGALLVVNEIYSHSWTETVRRSAAVEKVLYPRMRRLIYGPGKPYITEDERKLSERDVAIIAAPLGRRLIDEHFNFLVTRVVPDRVEAFARVDRLLLRLLKPVAPLLAGRVLFAGEIAK